MHCFHSVYPGAYVGLTGYDEPFGFTAALSEAKFQRKAILLKDSRLLAKHCRRRLPIAVMRDGHYQLILRRQCVRNHGQQRGSAVHDQAQNS